MLGSSVVLFVIGNKTELESQRNIQESEAQEYASSVGAGYCECSAKENVGVNELFDDITKVETLVPERGTSSDLRYSDSTILGPPM
ncbi:Small GTPase superfamily [Aphelenchoides avenae]|nr:Small GTPase superfamily [Aphelenchus avenae]